MTGYSSYNPKRSMFTLALLEDTGWYFPNYSVADSITFGQNGGCEFVMNRCNSRSFPYFATNSNQEGCMWDGLLKGRSNVRKYTAPLDPWYEYYTESTLGGNDDLADYCGFLTYSESYRGDCTIPLYNEPGDDYFLIENFGEHFCPTCRCISAFYGSHNSNSGPSCHNFTCVNGGLKIKIGYEWYDCPSNNYQIAITDGFQGAYECPSNVQQTCQLSPADNTVWPTFLDVNPKQGAVNDQITVSALNFGSNPTILLGNYHGCVSNTITTDGDSISCKIGIRDGAPRFRSSITVDVIVQDDQGRTASGIKSFTVSAATIIKVPGLLLLLLFVMIIII